MDDPVTARDVMNRSYVGVNEADSVAGAAVLMRDEGVDAAVVLRGNQPVGMLSANDIVDLVAGGDDPAEATVDDAMNDRVIAIEGERPLADAVTTLTDSDTRSALVMENGDIAGLLSEHDIVTAQSMLPTGSNESTTIPAEPGAELEAESLAGQGVCEICGSLARDLADVNGQVVCPACRTV